jgi:hypothetical protein
VEQFYFILVLPSTYIQYLLKGNNSQCPSGEKCEKEKKGEN